jgi:hypothetical protein
MSRVDELDVIIRRKKGRVIAFIPQLNLYAKADDVQTAMASLDEKKKTLIADLEDLGEFDRLELDGPAAGRPAMRAGMGPFAIKTAIVAVAVAAVIVVASGFIAGTVNNSIRETVSSVRNMKIGGAKFWSGLEETLDRLAEPGRDIPEAKKQKLLADIRAIGIKWRPFLVEIHSALDVTNSPETKANPLAPPETK